MTGSWNMDGSVINWTDLVQSCSNQKKKGIGEEFIWVNYELPPQARFYIRMSTEVSKANKN